MTIPLLAATTALLVIDIQPEWYSASHVSSLFPGLDKNVRELLAAARQHPSQIEVGFPGVLGAVTRVHVTTLLLYYFTIIYQFPFDLHLPKIRTEYTLLDLICIWMDITWTLEAYARLTRHYKPHQASRTFSLRLLSPVFMAEPIRTDSE